MAGIERLLVGDVGPARRKNRVLVGIRRLKDLPRGRLVGEKGRLLSTVVPQGRQRPAPNRKDCLPVGWRWRSSAR